MLNRQQVKLDEAVEPPPGSLWPEEAQPAASGGSGGRAAGQ
jgi:hypothetical protein